MGFIYFNPNPTERRVGDCAVRAVSKALGADWESTYAMIALNGFSMGDMPSSNNVWGSVLRQHGYKRTTIPNTCPDCYTIEDFCRDNPAGTFVIGTEGHVVTIIDGDVYDTWDSREKVPVYVWYKDTDPKF